MRSLDLHISLWAVDSGVDPCFEAGILPDKLVGDGDSASPEAWQWAVDNGSDVSKFNRDKDLTDFQIALDLLSEKTWEMRRLSLLREDSRAGLTISGLLSFLFLTVAKISNLLGWLTRSRNDLPARAGKAKDRFQEITGCNITDTIHRRKQGSLNKRGQVAP